MIGGAFVPFHSVSSLGFSVSLARVPFGLDPVDSFDAVDDLVIRNFIGTVRGVGSVDRPNGRSCRFHLVADGFRFGCSVNFIGTVRGVGSEGRPNGRSCRFRFDAVDDLVTRNFIGTVRGVGSVDRPNGRACRFRLVAGGFRFGCSANYIGTVRGVGSVDRPNGRSCRFRFGAGGFRFGCGGVRSD